MGKISEIFNFDNIGGKIKNLAKWSCWITILLTWIAAPIAFFVLVSDEWTAEFCWIPLVGAIVGPVLVWVESWVLYAFGEFVEKTADNENNTRQILKKLNEKSTDASITFIKNKEYSNKTTNTPQTASTHKWLCDGCKKMRTQTPCEHCGKE